MSELIDGSSALSSKCELNIFDVPPTQVAVERGFWTEIYPKNTITNDGPFEFQITSDPLYLDLNNNFLHLVVKVTKADGTNVAKEGDKCTVAPINAFGKTFFRQVKLWLNSKLAYDSNDTYAYRAYLETLLNYGSDAKNSHLQACMYSMDSAGNMESGENKGFDTRGEYANESRNIELMGSVHTDLFNQDRFLVNHMDVRLELHRNSNAFSLLTLADNQEYKIDIISMTWFVRKVDVLKSFALALETHISKQPAKYPIRRVMVKTLHVDGGRRDTPNNTLFTGQVPRRLIIGCVDKDAFFGHLRKNPFNFKNFGIKQIQVTAGDITYPRNPVVFDFPNKRYT
ncbi:MAG: hypothetical protein GY820_37745, partial [Gammaproteobacteria bacterium]|nr:hypothetical protein [Gammaproteobacteria bacterium]